MEKKMKEDISDLNDICEKYKKEYKEHEQIICELKSILLEKGLPIVLWGAGLKGVSFVDLFDPKAQWINYIVDRDCKKQGKRLDSGHVIKAVPQLDKEAVVIVVNKNYYASVCFDLIQYNFDVKYMKLLCLDQIMDGSIVLSDIRDETVWIRRKYYD